jgi:hypothetical protein
MRQASLQAVAEPFAGITTNGSPVPDLFHIESTGVSTRPVRDAAAAFLGTLDPEQRATTRFGIDDDAWRAWSNIHVFVMRHGVALHACSDVQRKRALDLIRASCSARGFTLARNIMRLNDVLAQVTGRREEYGEWYYWLSILGEPSDDQPWGWQIDGHHLIINCFVLGDQLVMSPAFYGSEPTHAESGPYVGTRVFEAEEQQALALMHSLSRDQRDQAMPEGATGQVRGRMLTEAFRDNLVVPYTGMSCAALSSSQRTQLLDLVDVYVGRMREGHARIRMDEVARHIEDTHLLWVGGYDDDSVFYYRVQSPVVLIEFDHLNGVAFDNEEPSRHHVHTVLRTPNGNDYGKDLLRQHLARDHTPTSNSQLRA